VVIWYRKWLVRAWLSRRGVWRRSKLLFNWTSVLCRYSCPLFFLILRFSPLFSLSLLCVCCIPLLYRMIVRPCWMLGIPVGRWFPKIPVRSPTFRAPELIERAQQLHQFYGSFFSFLSFLAHRIFIPHNLSEKYQDHQTCFFLLRKENIIYYEFLRQMKKQKTKKNCRVDKVLHHMHFPGQPLMPIAFFFFSFLTLSYLTLPFHYRIPPKTKEINCRKADRNTPYHIPP